MSDERLTTSSFQSLSVIHIIKSKSCLEEICPCQSYGSSRPLRSGCSSSTSGLSSFSRRVRGRLRGSGARRNEGGRDVVLTDADFPSNERPCGRSSACTHSCVRLKRKRRNRRPIRHAWLNDANSVAPVVHSHARGAILSRCRDRLLNPDKPDHITSYSGLLQRSSQLANALDSIGIKPGDRVATLAWNSYRHLELYFGISGMGAVCHTINPRLFVEQIVYIVNHAEDVVVFFDLAFVDLVYPLMPQCPTVEAWIYLGEAGDAKIVGQRLPIL